MTDPWLPTGPVRDPQLPREGFFSAGGYVVVYDSVWASTIEGHRWGHGCSTTVETYSLDFALSHGPELYLGYSKVACKLIKIYARCSNIAVYVIRG